MKRKFFIKNLISLVCIILVPIIILGSLSIYITQNYIQIQIDKNAENMLNQVAQNMELVLNDIDTLAINFDRDSLAAYYLNSLFNNRMADYPLVDIAVTNIISSNISSLSSTKPYIQSVYIYYKNDKNKVFTSMDGLTQISSLQNTNWYSLYQNSISKTSNTINDLKNISLYPSASYSQKTTSIYKRFSQYQGCIVLNIHSTYIQQMLNSLISFPGQSIRIFDENGSLLFKSGADLNLNYFHKANSSNDSSGTYSINDSKGKYGVIFLNSPKYGWTYCSATPLQVINSIPVKLSKYTLLLGLISLLFGIILSFILTKNTYNRMTSIINIFQSAEKGQKLPPLPDKVKDEYGYILQNIIKTFIENSYLSLQLSEKHYKLQAAELMALQSQINPHFLYNTLNSIYWEVFKITGIPNKANVMIEDLSDILRYSLQNPFEKVTVKDELKFTLSYIKIQMERYKDEFEFKTKYTVDEELNFKVMKLILQPFIENSIYHGIRLKNTKSIIRLKFYAHNNKLFFTIFDNGIGIKKEKLIDIKQKLQHEPDDHSVNIGIYNTNRRIKLMYGEQYGVRIMSTDGRGTLVKITFPIEIQ